MGTQARMVRAHQQNPVRTRRLASVPRWPRLNEYPGQLGIALTGALQWMEHAFGIEFASRYQGLRHDSGDPVAWGERRLPV